MTNIGMEDAKCALWQVFQIKWTNPAESMLRRFQPNRDNMGGPYES